MSNHRTIIIIAIICTHYTWAHIPIFGTECGSLPHITDHKISQAYYFKTNHIDGIEIPSSIAQNTIEDKDGLTLQVTLRHKYNINDFQLFVGCLPDTNNDIRNICTGITSFPYNNSNSITPKSPKLEPFSQSVYHMAVDLTLKNNIGTCNHTNGSYAIILKSTQQHFPILWSAVIGKGETFSLLQLLSYPLYLGHVHGSYGNERYRFYLLVYIFIGSVLKSIIGGRYFGLRLIGKPIEGLKNCLTCHSTNNYRHDIIYRQTRYSSLAWWFSLLACCWFPLAFMDMLFHLVDSAYETSTENAWSTFIMFFITLGIFASSLPSCLSFYIFGYHQTYWKCNNCVNYLFGALLLLYATLLCVLGDISVVVLMTLLITCTFIVLCIYKYIYDSYKSTVLSASYIALIISFILLFFIGSGYWIGPLLLTGASVCTMVHGYKLENSSYINENHSANNTVDIRRRPAI